MPRRLLIAAILLILAPCIESPPGFAGEIPILDGETLKQIFHELPEARESQSGNQSRLLLVGFDGFTWRQIQPLLDRGALHNLKKLMGNGIEIQLTATDFPSSAASWPSIMTGCEPETTGMYSFFRMDPETYELYLNHGGYRKTKALWEIVSDTGAPVFSVNVPMSWPPDNIRGTMITGLLSPESGVFTHPSVLSNRLREAGYVTGYRRFRDTLKFGGPAFTDNGGAMDVNTLFDIALNRYQVTHYLMTNTAWKFGTVVFTLVDRFQHNQTALGTPMIQHACRQMDVLLGGLMKAVPPDTFIVISSDHGFRRYDRTFLMGEWLCRNGFIVSGDDDSPDWDKTRLIPLDRVGNCGLYRWNVKGREARGVISPTAVSNEFQRLRNALKAIRDTDGRPVVSEVNRLSGDDGGPEILIRIQPDFLLNNFMGVQGPLERNLQQPIYDHEHEGIGVVSGPGIRHGDQRIRASVVDIAPTCLYALGLPVPKTMDGKVLNQVFLPEWLEKHTLEVSESSARKLQGNRVRLDDESVMSQLKSLGYIQ